MYYFCIMHIAIIPARKNSKRIKNKNIKIFFGKPIIAYSIEAAKKTKIFDEIYVSTNCPKIRKVAIKYGAKVPFLRSEKLSDSKAHLIDVLKDHLLKIENKKIEYVCLLFATAPLMSSNFIKKAFLKLKRFKKAFFCLSYTNFSFPILRSFSINKGYLKASFNNKMKIRSQDLEEKFHEAGQFMWIKKAAVFKNKLVFHKNNSIGYFIPRHFVCDVDTEQDWKMLKLQYEIIKKRLNY